jgi:hypothetical protein
MSSLGHDVSEYELGDSVYHPYFTTTTVQKSIFCNKKKFLVWCVDPPKDRVIAMFVGLLSNHDHKRSR